MEGLYDLSRELFDRDWIDELGGEPGAVLRVGDGDIFDQVSRLELGNYTLNMLLRDNDVMSMASSLELRVPLLDTDFVRFALSVPAEYKKRGEGVKPLLAAAVRGLVPESVLARKKQGFELPFAPWLRNEMRAE